jgi:purine-nucleoside phosphorylase
MPTPHNQAQPGDIAKTVLLPGDPLRAKFIAEHFLSDVKQFNTVRNMFGFTGTYKGKKVSVMGSGMGMPSLGIYTYELYTQYNVENIIRIGTAGSYQKDVKIDELVLAQGASTDSNYAYQYQLPGTFSALSSYKLLAKAVEIAKAKKMPYHVGSILSSDIFYNQYPDVINKWAKMGVLAVEMEAYALFCNAAFLNKNALAILTISDSLVTGEVTSTEHRQTALTNMFTLALDLATSD